VAATHTGGGDAHINFARHWYKMVMHAVLGPGVSDSILDMSPADHWQPDLAFKAALLPWVARFDDLHLPGASRLVGVLARPTQLRNLLTPRAVEEPPIKVSVVAGFIDRYQGRVAEVLDKMDEEVGKDLELR